LTTSFYIDILGLDKRTDRSEASKIRSRNLIHAGFSVVLLLVIIAFRLINKDSVITGIFTAAGYTYGPLLGLFAFGILSKRGVRAFGVPIVALLAPVLTYICTLYSEQFLNGYKIGFELLLINGLLTYLGLYLISRSKNVSVTA
jgi:hypothetical protein